MVILKEGRYSGRFVSNVWFSAGASRKDSGIYSGGTIQVPMGTKNPVQPNGYPNAITDVDDSGRKFGVFIIRTN